MRHALFALLATACLVTIAAAADEPLASFPYTPGIDVTAMDRTADPCQDFYQYACGAWIAHNPIPADQSSWDVYGKLYQDNQRYLWGILASLADAGQPRSPNQQKIGDLFAACMDEPVIERLGREPLAPVLASISSLRNRQQLPAVLADLQLQGNDSGFFFGFGSSQDYGDATQTIAFADSGGLGLPERGYYTDTDAHSVKLRQQYRRHVARMFELLGNPPDIAARNAATVMRVETQLARASLGPVERRNPYNLYHKLDRRALARLTPAFDWGAFMKAMGIAEAGSVNVTEPKFYKAFNQLVATTSLPDMRTYLRWHAAHTAAPYLSRAFQAENFAFYGKALRGSPEDQPRWKRCVAQVDSLLGEALGQEFVARTFGPEVKAATVKMATQVEQAMREDIEHVEWMSPATRAQALAKLDVIINKVGYPDRWRDYSAVDIRRDDLFGNVRRAVEFESRRQLAKIGQPLDRNEWFMTPPTVNAYFDLQRNDINFPAGVLQPPLYDPAMDDAPNYGNTGATIGHELTHGFDDEGRKFDAGGNLRDWWSPADAQEFAARSQCIVDQYAKYVVIDDIHINSRLTLGEDAADLGGLILAQMAWRAQTAGMVLPERDGLGPEQRFFVGYAQWACGSTRPEEERLRARTDPHSPVRYRVNGLMPNMPEFQRAFACKADSPMVSKNRCRIW